MKVVPLALSSLRLRVHFEKGQFTDKHSLMFRFVHNNIKVSFSNISYWNLVPQYELFRYINTFCSGLNSFIRLLFIVWSITCGFENYKGKNNLLLHLLWVFFRIQFWKRIYFIKVVTRISTEIWILLKVHIIVWHNL